GVRDRRRPVAGHAGAAARPGRRGLRGRCGNGHARHLRGTFRQRLRWARSWWWMLPFAYARLNLKQLASPTVGLIELVITPLVMIWAVTSWVIGFRLRL